MERSTPPYLCVIPARGGSVGVPRKNLRNVAGKPLVVWTIQQALEAGDRCRVVVSTDDDEIAAVAADAGADVPFLRPAALAANDAATEPVLLHALDHVVADGHVPDAVVLLQPTSPVRAPGAVRDALALYEQTGCDSVVSVGPVHPFLWHDAPARPLYDVDHRPRRQDIPTDERLFVENGSIYVTRTSALRATGNRVAGRVELLVMSELESIDVDDEDQLAIVDALLSRRGAA